MISKLTESIEDFIEDLSYPLRSCSRLIAAFSDTVAQGEEDCHKKATLEKSAVESASVAESLYTVQFQNSLEEVGYALDNCRQNMVSEIQSLLQTEQESMLPGTSVGQVKWASVMLLLAKELQAYHLAVSNSLVPVVSSLTRHVVQDFALEDKEKAGIVLAWKSVHEVNKLLRVGYGLTNQQIAVILAWMHGEDVSESTRKSLNQQVDALVQIYRERLCKSTVSELDVPVAFHCDPTLIKDILKDSCNAAEIGSALGQRIPSNKEELESLLHRELPRVPIVISGSVYEIASPGKAFENTKQKMHAVRDIVSEIAESRNVNASKEQLDLFCMRVLATVCTSVANAASRVAVLMAFGKVNLVQVKPPPSRVDDRQAHISASEGTIDIDVPSNWWLVEDSWLFSSLCRDQNRHTPIAVVEAVYQVSIDARAYLEKRIEPLPIVHVQRLPLLSPLPNGGKKEQALQKQSSLRNKLSKATKLFNRKSSIQKTPARDPWGSGPSSKEDVADLATNSTITEEEKSSKEQLIEDGKDPVPPPRPRRKARKSKRAKSEALRKERAQQRALDEAKKETDWFSSSVKVKSPAVHALKSGKGQKANTSVASFEELQEVIDFLSGSSSSSLCLTGTPEGDKFITKDGGPVVSKLAKQEVVKEPDGGDAKKDACQDECNPEEKGKTSPVDSGLGSTTSFLSSVSSVSAVSVLTADHFTPGDQSVLEEEQEPDKLSGEETETEYVPENMVDPKDHITTMHYGSNSVASSSLRDQEFEIRAKNETSVLSLDLSVKTTEETKCDFPVEQLPVGDSSSIDDDVRDSELEVWKDPGVVDPFDCMLESPESIETGNSNDTCEDDTDMNANTFCLPDESSSQTDGDTHSATPPPRLTKTLSHPSLKGSTESLYYSAWSLNEFCVNKKTDEDEALKDDRKGSCFSSPVTSALDVSCPTSESVNAKQEVQGKIFDPFNSRYSWHDIIGENLGLLWNEGAGKKVADEQHFRDPWPQHRKSPVGNGTFTNEGASLEGSRLSQWTAATAMKRGSLPSPFSGPWQSRSNPDVQRQLTIIDAKVRHERVPSPLTGGRPEVSASNWPMHGLARRGSFPHAVRRDAGSPRDVSFFGRETVPARDVSGFKPDSSPTSTPRGMLGGFNPAHTPGTVPTVWPQGNEGKFTMRPAIPQTAVQSNQSMPPSRNRLSHTVSLPLSEVSHNMVNTPGSPFGLGPRVPDGNANNNFLSHSGNFGQQDLSPYQVDPAMFMPFHPGVTGRDTLSKRFPMQKRQTLRDHPVTESQLPLQGHRLVQGRNQRQEMRFPDSFHTWNTTK